MEEGSLSELLQVKDKIIDVYETSKGYIVVMDGNREVVLDKRLGRTLYWAIKRRNRRRAFGL